MSQQRRTSQKSQQRQKSRDATHENITERKWGAEGEQRRRAWTDGPGITDTGNESADEIHRRSNYDTKQPSPEKKKA